MNTGGPSALRNTFATFADYQGKAMTMIVCWILQHYSVSICNWIAFAVAHIVVVRGRLFVQSRLFLFRYTLKIKPLQRRVVDVKRPQTLGLVDVLVVRTPTACTWVIREHFFVLVGVILGL